MAEFVQLDRAAAAVGKSEVTLRRLIKAGKIPFNREKTLTGFIYLVDVDVVRDYYGGKDVSSEPLEMSDAPEAEAVFSGRTTATAVRVAVADESGSMADYWRKKSDAYEERYGQEVLRHANTRQELGLWRGRAEQAQAMVMNLLPSSTSPAEVAPTEDKKESNAALIVVCVVLGVILVAVIAAGAYLALKQ